MTALLPERWLLPWVVFGGIVLAPLQAEASPTFARNHPELEWYSIETDHFVIHYPQARRKEANKHYLTAEWTARRSAKVLEEIYPRECAIFNYWLQERVHVVIRDQGDDLEGFALPSRDWISISANPGMDLYRLLGHVDWLSNVLAHEFAQMVSLKAQSTHAEGVKGIALGALGSDGRHDTEAGANVFISENAGQMWVEGGAELWSDEAGYNEWTPSRDMQLRTTILADRQLTWTEWQIRTRDWTWNDPERYYPQGYSFALYLRDRFGSGAYQKLGLENAKVWRADWNDVFELVLGVGGETLYNDWLASVRAVYEKQYEVVKAEGETVGRELGTGVNDWEYSDSAGRDVWYGRRWTRRTGVTGLELAMHGREHAKMYSGSSRVTPRYSDDGRWVGRSNGGIIHIEPIPEGAFTALGGGR